MARRPETLAAHVRALDALARRGRLRKLAPRTGIDFTSNDYLGLASSPELIAAARDALDRGVPLGAGGSRLLRGNHNEHEALEHEAARFFGSEAALYFGGGFSANAALIATMPARGDLIVHDALIHASAWDGMAQSKAVCVSARHNDVDAFAAAIRRFRESGQTGRVWIAVESLYSMEGDLAPLADLAALAGQTGAMLLIDEAHATGVLGPDGRGLGAALEGLENVVCLHTCGKALGASGALITSTASIRDFLINRARSFIYATAPSPVMAAIVRRALAIVATQPERRAALAQRVAYAANELNRTCGLPASGTHIMPVIVGTDARAVAIADAMQRAGYDIRAIRPPTVPEGTARLRITLTLNTDEAEIPVMLATLREELRDSLFSPPKGEDARRRGASLRDAGAGEGLDPMAGVDVVQSRSSAASSRSDAMHRARAPSPVPGHEKARTAPHVSLAAPHPDPVPVKSRDGERGKFVITGTGTGVGKTVFAAALVAALDGEYWKPVQAGLVGESDTLAVRRLSGLPADRFHAEAYRLHTPVSPHRAAEIDGVDIDAEQLEPPQTARPLIIEGAGGLMVPLTLQTLLIDVLARWQIPVILVANTALGTINHTLLSIEALRARDVPIHGVAFIGDENAPSEEVICERGQVRRLGRLPLLDVLSADTLRLAFAAHFNIADFAAGAAP